ncbi:MAG TPA: tetratricopeptide repeat protein [Sphaerochaeta sp.]|nr:tetratricopeptide repeat protein [Sphaerochaeta sp.]
MKGKKNLGLWLSLLVTVVIIVLKIPPLYKVALLALFIAGLLFIRRGIFPYMKANKKVTSTNSDDWPAAFPLYRKAIKAGIQKPYVITAASMFLQRGDREEGKQILLDYLASSKGKDPALDGIAKTMLSMAYWMEGDLSHALSVVDEVHQSGQRDKNLYINYSTYLIEDGQRERAQSLIDEARDNNLESPGILDNQGWLYILSGRWEEAEELFGNLVSRGPRFAEPFVHYAQVLIHFGEVQAAIEQLESATGCTFSNTSAMKEGTVQALLDGLKDPKTRINCAKAIDRDPAAVASGRLPAPIKGEAEPSEEAFLPGFAVRSRKKIERIKPQEREPNLELTEEDLALIEELERS